MQIALKIVILITLSLLGGIFYALTANFLIMGNMIPTDSASGNFGYDMTSKTVFIWLVSVMLGIVSLFIKQKWRYILLLCPLLAPSAFAFLFALNQ